MKILHICLGCFYIDNYSYQENMLPKYHKILGYDVSIIASLSSFDESGNGCYLPNESSYINEYEIPVTRIDYLKPFKKVSKLLKIYNSTYKLIVKEKPDITFIHGCQFLDICKVVKYIKKNDNVKVYVDNHADFSNSATNWLSKNILHKIIWRYCAQIINPYTTKFYGVIPARVDFLKDMYKIPKEKIDLLIMGADDEKVEEAQSEIVKKAIRAKYNIEDDDFLIMTGGKIDTSKKQTLLLMQAVKQIKNEKIKLIVFGSVTEELNDKLNSLCYGEKVQYIGWVEAQDSYKYFATADLVIFPGRHSVFWEQVTGQGIPMVCKYWEGTTHMDVGGNVKFLKNDSVEEIQATIEGIVDVEHKYDKMKSVAINEGKKSFSYRDIARRSIEVR